MAADEVSSQSLFFTIPRELRDEIYSYLTLPQSVLTSTPQTSSQSVHRSNKISDAYLDSRIYLPSRPPVNALGTCRQLREEILDFVSRSINLPGAAIPSPFALIEEWKKNHSALSATVDLEDAADQVAEIFQDDGCARFTLEIQRVLRTSFGSFTPDRVEPSPRFLALNPFLSRLKRVRFTVWGSWDWFKGQSAPHITRGLWEKSRFRRSLPSQTDEVHANKPQASNPQQLEPNPLSVAMAGLMAHLPLVEEIHINILMHAADYWNWDLPENRQEGIRPWLEGPAFPLLGPSVKKVYRKLTVGNPMEPQYSAIYYHKLETYTSPQQDGKRLVSVWQGAKEVPEEIDGVQEDPAFTKIYERNE
ncbi:hypothetical protein EJ04DRAFT_190916 [Polyplosphaeria fusca]|uniref:F-box domain-containing protein n=1 Tax=Polyplosphaeria fusca TaxID=682080 RepID=A0A9P4R2J7_9PLEO|nr:hypothetical protein EJ04DRAFT_190916 [Polyplosphaeria fusca]